MTILLIVHQLDPCGFDQMEQFGIGWKLFAINVCVCVYVCVIRLFKFDHKNNDDESQVTILSRKKMERILIENKFPNCWQFMMMIQHSGKKNCQLKRKHLSCVCVCVCVTLTYYNCQQWWWHWSILLLSQLGRWQQVIIHSIMMMTLPIDSIVMLSLSWWWWKSLMFVDPHTRIT